MVVLQGVVVGLKAAAYSECVVSGAQGRWPPYEGWVFDYWERGREREREREKEKERKKEEKRRKEFVKVY